MDIQCCALSAEHGDRASVCTDRIVTARKDHKCYECTAVIPKGAQYEFVKGCWDGAWSSYRTCLLCVEIRGHFACDEGWLIGEVWSQLEESFFPDMTAGGPCMTGLSPEAKAVLFDRRLRWFADEEWLP